MKPRLTPARLTFGTAATFALLAAAFAGSAAAQGYYMQRSGCTPQGGQFCTAGVEVCDTGWSTSPDTGSGQKGPLTGSVERSCYKLGDTLTTDCVKAPQGYKTVGCVTSGICCYSDTLRDKKPIEGSSMQTPDGEACN